MTVTIWDKNVACGIATLHFDEAFYNVNSLIKISFWTFSTLSLSWNDLYLLYYVSIITEIETENLDIDQKKISPNETELCLTYFIYAY